MMKYIRNNDEIYGKYIENIYGIYENICGK
jgi:hypothetical protein